MLHPQLLTHQEKYLYSQNMIHEKLRESVKKVIDVPFIFPKDIIKALKKDEEVWNNYQAFSDSYKRIRIAYIDAARKRPEEFKKRLNNFIKKTKENKIIAGLKKDYLDSLSK